MCFNNNYGFIVNLNNTIIFVIIKYLKFKISLVEFICFNNIDSKFSFNLSSTIKI